MWTSIFAFAGDAMGDLWEFVIDMIVTVGLWFLTPITIMMAGVTSILDSVGLSTLFNLGGLPAEFLEMFSRLGLGTCMVIIGAGYAIRVVIQAIPFVRWGS